MRKWGLFLFGGWATVTLGLFLAIVAGTVAEAQFSIIGNGQKLIQAVVMSVIVVPAILYLYQRMYQQIGKTEKPAHALNHMPHFFTGFLLVIVLTVTSLFSFNTLGLITIEQWHTPQSWIGALLLNMLIAFFYEALPEELAVRGLIYDVLHLRLSVWQSVLVQALIFIAFSASISLLLVMTGISPASSIAALPSQLILHFFFGIALALIRVWTGSLWAAIGFHLGYLAMARFLLMPTEYGAPPVVTYQDTIMQGVGGSLAVMFIILGTIFLLLILLGIRTVLRRKDKHRGSRPQNLI